MTISQLIKLVRRKLLESSEEVIDNDTLMIYANERKDEIARRFLANKTIKPTILTFTNGIATKPTDWNGHYLSADSNIPRTGNEFKMVTIDDFQAGIFPNMITESEEGNILVFPTTTPSIYTWYYKKLPDMALTPSVIDFPTAFDAAFQRPLLYGVLSSAFEDIQDPELSKFYDDKFEVELQKASMSISTLEESSMDATELLRPLPDINFSSARKADDPNFW